MFGLKRRTKKDGLGERTMQTAFIHRASTAFYGQSAHHTEWLCIRPMETNGNDSISRQNRVRLALIITQNINAESAYTEWLCIRSSETSQGRAHDGRPDWYSKEQHPTGELLRLGSIL